MRVPDTMDRRDTLEAGSTPQGSVVVVKTNVVLVPAGIVVVVVVVVVHEFDLPRE